MNMNANNDRPKSIEMNFQQNAQFAITPHTDAVKTITAHVEWADFCHFVVNSSAEQTRSQTKHRRFVINGSILLSGTRIKASWTLKIRAESKWYIEEDLECFFRSTNWFVPVNIWEIVLLDLLLIFAKIHFIRLIHKQNSLIFPDFITRGSISEGFFWTAINIALYSQFIPSNQINYSKMR